MNQPGFFDWSNRQQKLLKTRKFLEKINIFVNWEVFRPVLDVSLNRSARENGGRPPFDSILMFKILILQALYNLSDEQTEYQILDRLSFMRFLGLELQDVVPDARTIWSFRECLIDAKAVEKLFKQFDDMLENNGFKASGGQIIDATFVEVPRQRNSKDDNKTIKQGKIPADWNKKKVAHKDTDARWTKKNALSYYGYKNHVNVDRKYKLIRKYKITDSSVHDSQELNDIIYEDQENKELWADSAYRSEEQEAKLKEKDFNSHIHERAYRNTPLTEAQELLNKEKSRVRARVEHVFGHVETAMNGFFVRTIGLARAEFKITMTNLSYNISRFTFLQGATGAPA